VLAAAALGLAGCGEDRGSLTSTDTVPPPAARAPRAPAPPPAEVRLTEREYRLDPAGIRVDRPAVLAVDVRNRGRERHALTVKGPSGTARTRVLAPGEAVELRVDLDEPGRYRWFCPVDGHARRGMRGTITVARG
jgi:plastocyanin